MPQVSFGTFSKRRNSTKQPSGLPDTRNVKLKELTSYDAPTFILTGDDFEYNYAQWGDRYYFVTDVRSVHNNLCEVDCVLDPLATYKSEILTSTQYVSYSSLHGATWLPDTRIPITRNAHTQLSTASLDYPDSTGVYILTVTGKSGVDCFKVSRSTIQNLIEGLQNWSDDLINQLMSNWNSSEPEKSFAEVMANTSMLGNAYEVAVQAIRSCHWVPFSGTMVSGTNTAIYLGNYPAKDSGGNQLYGEKLSLKYITGNVAVSIPWYYSDWRRTYCENVYLYLPFVGMTSLNVDDIASENSLTIKYSFTASDGNVCYEVFAGNQVIGTFGGNCAMQIPIGINQKSSLSDVVTTLMQGAEKTVSCAVSAAETAGKLNVLGAAARGAEAGLAGFQSVYNTANVALSTTMSTIGGVGGGAGAGLDLVAKCFTVARDTVVTPSEMVATMGQPTMKPVTLSSLSGYCQCANAHVECAAQANELDAIDAYLNSGFFIE